VVRSGRAGWSGWEEQALGYYISYSLIPEIATLLPSALLLFLVYPLGSLARKLWVVLLDYPANFRRLLIHCVIGGRSGTLVVLVPYAPLVRGGIPPLREE